MRALIGLMLLVGVLAGQKPTAALELEARLRERLAQPMANFDMDLVMLGDDFFGTEPQPLRFSADGTELWFRWKKWDERDVGIWVCNVADGSIRRLADDEEAPPAWGWSRDRAARACVQNGVLRVVRDGVETAPLKLARSPWGLQFSAEGAALQFRSEKSWFALSGSTLEEVLVQGDGHRKPDAKPAADKPSAAGDASPTETPKTLPEWHKQSERGLFRLHWEAHERAEREKTLAEARKAKHPEIFRYEAPEGWRCTALELSPAGTHAAALIVKDGPKDRVAEMPDYLNAEGYTNMLPTRPKVGEGRAERRAELIDLAARKITEVKLPDAGLDAGGCHFSPDGTALLLTAESRDDTRALLCGVALDSGALSVLHEVRDEAWVLGHLLNPQWLADGHSAVFRSEKNGWMQLYVVDAKSCEVRQLTDGRFEFAQVQVAPDGTTLWCVATPLSPHSRDLVKVDARSGDITVVDSGGGRRILLSPDGTTLAEVHSTANQPWELRLRSARTGATTKVTDSPSPAFRGYAWSVPPIVHIPASDGVLVPARIFRPTDGPVTQAADGKLRPAVMFVHGAGYLQNVHDWWSQYQREYAFHHMLRDEGFVVIDIDYRGSSGYGRDWRTAIRGHMGGRDLGDYSDGARWLAQHEQVDPQRIGLYGGSYGGFMTLMALFTQPDIFAAGAALRPVTDWAHYNDGYTANILDTPLENPDAFARSSPIHFAEGLRGRLLICHGFRDDNVHVQDTVRLQQRLIELRKDNWEVAYYPAEAHGFRDAASWSDEYRRILKLMRVLKASARN